TRPVIFRPAATARTRNNGPMADTDDADSTPRDPRDLRDRFARALEGARGPGGGPDPGPYADNLLARWREPQRRYHTVAHLTAVLDRVDELAEYAGDPDVVRLAAWFHDAVYLPDRSENEERSARLAGRALPEAGVPEARAAAVARLVRVTGAHHPADHGLHRQVPWHSRLA